MRLIGAVAALIFAGSAQADGPARSTCYGTSEKGRLDRGVSLPRSGANFEPYSDLGVTLGRTCVHSVVAEIVSVDFMVPVQYEKGVSVPLPTSHLNKYGYDIEFDANGRYQDLRIDFRAITAHLFHLERQASTRGVRIRRVILAPEFERKLAETPHWRDVSARVPFSKGKPWVRHDEHYHVDFLPGCRPL